MTMMGGKQEGRREKFQKMAGKGDGARLKDWSQPWGPNGSYIVSTVPRAQDK